MISRGTYGFYSISIKQVNTVKKEQKSGSATECMFSYFVVGVKIVKKKRCQTEEGRLYLLHLFFFSKHYIDHHIHLQSFQVHVKAEVNVMWLC